MIEKKQNTSQTKEVDSIPLESWMLEIQRDSQKEHTINEHVLPLEEVSKTDRIISWTHAVLKSPNPDMDPVTGEIHKPENCESCGA